MSMDDTFEVSRIEILDKFACLCKSLSVRSVRQAIF